MSSVQFMTIGGKRIDVTGSPSEWQTRCDGCGQFINRGSYPVTFQGEVILPPNPGGSPHVGYRFDLHEGCANDAVIGRLIGEAIAPRK